MKLIDILVQELPKRGGWTAGAVCITQDADGSICTWGAEGVFFRGHWQHPSGKSLLKYWCREGFEITEDYATAIITREQYKAALKQPVWDGTSLPPVGVECEMANENGTYKHVKIIAIEDGFVIGWDNKRMITYISNSTVDFRPILTERDEAIHEIASMIGRGTFYEDAERIYDAGYRKQ